MGKVSYWRLFYFHETYKKEKAKISTKKETKTYTQEEKMTSTTSKSQYLNGILKEYLHLQKTKTGVAKALKEKEVELSNQCRKILMHKIRWNSKTVLMAEIILEHINGK